MGTPSLFSPCKIGTRGPHFTWENGDPSWKSGTPFKHACRRLASSPGSLFSRAGKRVARFARERSIYSDFTFELFICGVQQLEVLPEKSKEAALEI